MAQQDFSGAGSASGMAPVLVAGAGIAGLSAALACQRAGIPVSVYERSAQASEQGAGIQLGPNAMRVLAGWGLMPALQPHLVLPEQLEVRSARGGQVLGRLGLGASMRERYHAPYGLIHRADLHRVLLEALDQQHGVSVSFGQRLLNFGVQAQDLWATFEGGAQAHGHCLLGADGGFSTVRAQLLGDGPPAATGHMAYRALIAREQVPPAWRTSQVTVWLAPGLHVVHYPLRQGACLNVVVLMEGTIAGELSDWDHEGHAEDVQQHLQQACPALRELVFPIAHWRRWGLSARAPMRSAAEQAQGPVALLGDAAHPMLPYLAQGAAMALEDAQALAQALQMPSGAVPERLQRYAQWRWRRNARVQATAMRNGHIFHARGAVAWARDLGMRVLGQSLLDMPWLYR